MQRIVFWGRTAEAQGGERQRPWSTVHHTTSCTTQRHFDLPRRGRQFASATSRATRAQHIHPHAYHIGGGPRDAGPRRTHPTSKSRLTVHAPNKEGAPRSFRPPLTALSGLAQAQAQGRSRRSDAPGTESRDTGPARPPMPTKLLNCPYPWTKINFLARLSTAIRSPFIHMRCRLISPYTYALQ